MFRPDGVSRVGRSQTMQLPAYLTPTFTTSAITVRLRRVSSRAMTDESKEDEIYEAVERRQGWTGSQLGDEADCEAGIFHIERGPGGEIKHIRRMDESTRVRVRRKLGRVGRRLIGWIYSKIRSRDR